MTVREGHWQYRDWTLRLFGTRNTYPVHVVYSRVRWISTGHGPQTWPWWRLISWKLYQLDFGRNSASSGSRVWFYTRWGCWHVDFIVDRRPKQ
ncbi:hypothetical protein [Bradyrhizobium pachyrhizi]|uniref:hypothetical protein n=1 Tax=Bradyrhizobium pachyrhizi TaxID=280333 RepID=UPI003D36D368